MTRFEAAEPRMAELVRMRFFAGLAIKEAAEQLEISPVPLRLINGQPVERIAQEHGRKTVVQ